MARKQTSRRSTELPASLKNEINNYNKDVDEIKARGQRIQRKIDAWQRGATSTSAPKRSSSTGKPTRRQTSTKRRRSTRRR